MLKSYFYYSVLATAFLLDLTFASYTTAGLPDRQPLPSHCDVVACAA